MAKPIMTIVGFGPMGRRFTRLFCEDLDVRVSSSRDVGRETAELGATTAGDRRQAFASSDYIFLAVPLAALPELVVEVNAASKLGTIVIDCCSARVPAEQSLSQLERRHFGMHDVKSGEYCITGDINDEMAEFFRRRGITINRMSPEAHDRINAVIGLGHFVGLALKQFLTEDEKGILAGIGSGAKVIALIDHLARDSPTTWRETQMANQFTKEQRADLIGALTEYHEALSHGEYPFD